MIKAYIRKKNISTSKTIITDELNVNLIQSSPSQSAQIFADNFHSESFKSLISIETRLTDKSQTCLYHIFTNLNLNVVSCVLNLKISDNCAVFCSLSGSFEPSSKNVIKFRNNWEANIEMSKFELSSTLQKFTVFDNFPLDHQFEIQQSILIQTYNKCCPLHSKTVSHKKNQSTLHNWEASTMYWE